MTYPTVFRTTRKSERAFLADYQPDQAGWSDSTGTTVLMYALKNADPVARVAIANRLIDDGADTAAETGDHVNALHTLLSAMRHDFATEPALLQRLIDGGADVNLCSGQRYGTPMQALSRMMAFSDTTLAPFYDVMFACPQLDVTTQSRTGRSVMDSARAAGARRGDLLARCEAHLAHAVA